jgi:hypothetical protein
MFLGMGILGVPGGPWGNPGGNPGGMHRGQGARLSLDNKTVP